MAFAGDFPKIVAFDTDWTLWQGWLDSSSWGKGLGAASKQEDNIERVDRWMLRDKSNHSYWISAFNDISAIINNILQNGAQLAIVARNGSKPMCDRALYYLNAARPPNGNEWSIIDLASFNEVANESKANHFRRIRHYSQLDYSDMLMFDDEAYNNVVKIELGTAFKLIPNRVGMTWTVYQQGLDAWRLAKNLRIISMVAGGVPNRRLIGYSGLPPSWIQLVQNGEGIVDTTTPYRWGFGLYVAPSMSIARYFRDWNTSFVGTASHVCEVWVKDYFAWENGVAKVWVPENNGNLPQMNPMNTTAEETALNQENRDSFIASRFGVSAPYVLFSQHFWMDGMPLPRGQRWAEMVVSTQVYRSLFEVYPLSDAQLGHILVNEPFPFGNQFRTWHITTPEVTREEFLRNNESGLYEASRP
ncbi:acid phosphatase-domain-containing protein [Crepidotus variabilis]|uniref:Acid phosphatase-domain-containing protein n=1 Tax=Crepidotus variabilis TaxID=179855 RepID=A0A9P6EIB2_9AGAR|nr:acid phosphatase-domain-containing protein [Crepidotus variabilis]